MILEIYNTFIIRNKKALIVAVMFILGKIKYNNRLMAYRVKRIKYKQLFYQFISVMECASTRVRPCSMFLCISN